MSKKIIKFICENDNIELRNEIALHVSHKFYRNLKCIEAKVLVNGNELEWYKTINKGDEIEITYEKEDKDDWPLYESKLDIIFEDEHYLIVNKRHGLLSIPTKGEPYSLYQEALYYLKSTNQDMNVSILNRLDKDTCGLVLLAKDRLAAYYLSPTHEHMVRKYQCLCEGIFESDNGTIKTYIDRYEDSNKRYVSDNTGKLAISHYNVLKRYSDKTLCEFILETGRTHQIRLHTSYLNHPIIGDTMYGNGGERLFLCSYYIEFEHPFTKKMIKFSIKPDFVE